MSVDDSNQPQCHVIICWHLQDPYWHKLLWHCSENNSYQGCPLPERQYHAQKESEDYPTATIRDTKQ